ncbi:MAG: response regulator transcription factor [Bacteroidales bacterium]|nr:response regulator transcription factor [Bacteroidales bacterium]
MIRILITDDHPFLRHGLRQILEEDSEKRFGEIAEAGNGAEMLRKIMEGKYDIVILDISLPGRSGLDLIADVRNMSPGTKVLVLSMFSEEQYAIKALRLGASGYLTKTSAPDELIKALVRINNGGRYITASLAEKITFDFLDEKGKSDMDLLSPREMEVIAKLSSGRTVSAIAEELSLSPKTISTYRERILKKLNLKTTSDIIRYAIRKGLV